MWIEPVMGHYFLACNLLWPCSFIGTSDTELSGIHWSWKVSYMKSRVSQWSREKQRRWDTTWRAHVSLSCYITNQPVQYRAPIQKYILKKPEWDFPLPACLWCDIRQARRFVPPTQSETRFTRIITKNVIHCCLGICRASSLTMRVDLHISWPIFLDKVQRFHCFFFFVDSLELSSFQA